MNDSVIAPRVRAVENMVARARSRTRASRSTSACAHCHVELWVSFFFDGTNNHRVRDFPTEHSNVAALFDAHERDDDLGVRAFYYEGVGTEFEFEDRIEEKTIHHQGTAHRMPVLGYRENESTARQAVGSGIDIRLEKAIFEFEMYVRDWKLRKRVDAINVAAFGFSRGAATARAFANWLAHHRLVRTHQDGLEFDGVPLRFRFLGIFDTVESIGLGRPNTRPELIRTSLPGHVERALHCVAAHELRPTFGLTGLGSERYVQVVYPGAHSDIGGGYRDGSQGRSNALAKVPLLQMLDHARGAGLKLLSIGEMRARGAWQDIFAPSFELPAEVSRDLSRYMSHVRTGSGPMNDVFLAHMEVFWQWLDSGHAAQANAEIFREHWTGARASEEGAGEVRRELGRVFNLYAQLVRTDEGRGAGHLSGAPAHPPAPDAVAPGIDSFFRRYVHDSQAGFVRANTLMKDFNHVDYYRVRAIHAPAA